jgi:hypothetical protein
MIPEFLRIRIEMRFGKPIRYAKDCEALASAVSKYCNQKISATTIMRVFSIMKSKSIPRLYTLDLISQYAGFDSWDAAVNNSDLNEDFHSLQINKLAINSLHLNQLIQIKYSPNRLLKIKYLGSMNFETIMVENSKLHVGDILTILCIQHNYPFICENVTRKGKELGKYVGGKEGSVLDISLEP